MSWDFEAKLSDLPPNGIKFEPDKPGSVPMRGDWSLHILDKGDDLTKHGTLAYAAFGERVSVTGDFAYFVDGALRQIDMAPWGVRVPPPELDEENGLVFTIYTFWRSKTHLAEDGKLPLTVQCSLQQGRCTITFTQEPEGDVARVYRTPTLDSAKALQLASESTLPQDTWRRMLTDRCIADLSHSPIMDVRLLFKRADDRELELWTTADFLGNASDYYKALFSSGAAETVTRSRSKRQRGPNVTSEQKPLAGAARSDPKADWEDSDDETDAFLVERDWMSCTTTKQDTAEIHYQQIDVSETAYSTMCAVLLYLQTGHIKFAPLRSSHALSPDELVTKRKNSLATSLDEHPTLPPPVSPKSVYRLAHLLEREELQKLALDSFASDLTISGAADELFGPAAQGRRRFCRQALERGQGHGGVESGAGECDERTGGRRCADLVRLVCRD